MSMLIEPERPRLVVKLSDGSDYTMYTPTPKGEEFHNSQTKNLIAKGNRGGGKSIILRFDAHLRALTNPGANLVLVRNTYGELQKSHVYFQGLPWGSLKAEMQLLGGYFNKGEYICFYPNGSKLFLTYVGDEKAATRLLSAEFLAAYFDELSTIPWDYFNMMCASVRVPKGRGWKPVVRAATNPLGQSTPEIFQFFIDKDEIDYEIYPDYNPDDWQCIIINAQDNTYIDSDEYLKDLKNRNLPEHVRKAWIEGEYVDESALFSFSPTKDDKPYHVLRELDIKRLVKNARIFRVYDHGYKPDPAYCAWIAHLGNRYIVFHEKTWYETIVSDIAEEIKEIDKELGIERVVACYCDPVIDIKTGQDIRTIKDIFEDHGVPMDCSINNREQFASAVHTALAEEASPGVPRIQIYNNGPRIGCPYLVKAIPLQKFNPKRPLALADHKHDHPVVSIAYFLISHSADERRPVLEKKYQRWMKPTIRDKWILGKTNVRSKREPWQ